MLFKWARYCSRLFAKTFLGRTILLQGLFWSFLFSFADARTLVTHTNSGIPDNMKLDGQQGKFYLYVGPTLKTAGAADYFSGDIIDPTANGETDTNFANAIKLKVRFYGVTIPSGQQGMLSVQVSGTGSTGTTLAPIFGYDNTSCASSGACQSQNLPTVPAPSSQNGLMNGHYYGVPYSSIGSDREIYLYPYNICKDYNVLNSGQSATGCSTTTLGGFDPPTQGTNVVTMSLTVSLYAVANSNAGTGATGTAIDTLSGVSIVFQKDHITLLCSNSGINDPNSPAVYPGDGGVTFDTRKIGAGPSTAGLTADNLAPPAYVRVVANDGTDPVADSTLVTGARSNSIDLSFSPGNPAAWIGPMTNSKAIGEHPYRLSVMLQDAAGVYAFPTANGNNSDVTACRISNVYSSSTTGYFKKDVKDCFFLRTVYASQNPPPMSWLRGFRDQILQTSPVGRKVVGLYYQWSPLANRWASEHPIVRLPILLLVTPIEAVAWILVKPELLVILWIMGIVFGGYLFLWARRGEFLR